MNENELKKMRQRCDELGSKFLAELKPTEEQTAMLAGIVELEIALALAVVAPTINRA